MKKITEGFSEQRYKLLTFEWKIMTGCSLPFV